MRDAVECFAGTVAQCSGDRLVALFGAPLAQEDHVVRALQAALGLQRAVAARGLLAPAPIAVSGPRA